MTIQKNFDSTLPASHTIKLSFTMRPDSPLANVKQVSVQFGAKKLRRAMPLKGITVPVTENSFLIGLSRGDGEASNLNLLRGLGMVRYTDGSRQRPYREIDLRKGTIGAQRAR